MSEGFAAFVAHLVFWVVLILGWFFGALGPRLSVLFIGLWLAGLVGLLRLPYVPSASFTALLDIALVLVVFQGDVRLR